MLAGTTIDRRFVIESEIGSGGMGTVYRALDRARGVHVAVKLLSSQLARDANRFAREIELIGELSHPGIVGYVAHGRIAGTTLYYVMDWIDGMTLGEYLALSGASVAQSVGAVRALAGALGHAHRRGILHRDLKPSNVLLDGGDIAKPKLIDFGLARRMRDVDRFTRTGNTIGTPGYMSPEQVYGDREIDARSDVFALGCLLYECLADGPAFAGGNWLIVQSRILLAWPRALAEVPARLAAIVDRMIAKEPSERYADGNEVAAALDALGDVATLGSRPRTAIGARPIWRFPEQHACYVVAIVDEAPPDLAEVVAPFGAQLSRLADGALVLELAPSGGERADVRANACAHALRERLPNAPIAAAGDAAELERVTNGLVKAHVKMALGRPVPPIREL